MDKRKKIQKQKLENSKSPNNNLLLKNEKINSTNSPRFKTSNNTKINLRKMDKKYLSKRDEILSKEKTVQSPNHSKKFSNTNYNSNNNNLPLNENVAQTLFDFTFPYVTKKDKEGLILDLYHVTNEMDEQNNKLEDLHNEYNNLISNCFSIYSLWCTGLQSNYFKSIFF